MGETLIKHAVHEAGHERLFIQDTQQLSTEYTSRYGELVDADALLSQPATPAMQRYIDLHEATIAGPAPFAQVAIELEIEGLSVRLGPTLLQQLDRILGASIVARCTFLSEHVALDVGHTALNGKMLERLIAARPQALPILVDTGQRALEAYLSFLGECMQRADEGVAVAVGVTNSAGLALGRIPVGRRDTELRSQRGGPSCRVAPAGCTGALRHPGTRLIALYRHFGVRSRAQLLAHVLRRLARGGLA